MKIEDYPIFRSHMDTLKEMSKDTSTEPAQYMTESTTEAVNFDKVKQAYVNRLGLSEEAAKSCDTLAFLSGGPTFIEFKNGKVSPGEIKNKIRDSLLIYGGITGQSITETRQIMEFVLVYNPEKNIDKSHQASRETIAELVTNKAKVELRRFDLEHYRTLYFRDVHTYTPEEFENYLGSRALVSMTSDTESLKRGYDGDTEQSGQSGNL